MPNTKIINQDGKRYEFTPGKGGSLTVRGTRQLPAAFNFDADPGRERARVIGPSDDAGSVAGVDDPIKRRARVIGPATKQYALKTYNGRQVYDTEDR